MRSKRTKKVVINLVSILFLLSVISIPSEAQMPKKINYQGILTDASGNPINGSMQMTFSIYDVHSGGTPLWNETQTVTVNDGRYSVLLGSVNPITLTEVKPYSLGVKVGSDSEMTPRKEMTGTIYDVIQGSGSGGADSDWVESDGNIYRETGNVGIGTTTPHRKLDVKSDENVFARLTSGSGAWAGLEFDGVGNMWKLERDPSGMMRFTEMDVGYPMVIQNGTGNVGIGATNPGAKLDVVGDLCIGGNCGGDDASNHDLKFAADAGGEGMQFDYYAGQMYIGEMTSGNWHMVIGDNGNVGIGTINPGVKLEVSDSKSGGKYVARFTKNGSGPGWIGLNGGDGGGRSYFHFDSGLFGIYSSNNNQTSWYHLNINGNTGLISTNGKIGAREVIVRADMADYVFEDDYGLMSLNEVEQYIKAHKHLPNIPSVKEVDKNGLGIGEMQTKLLEKIEELTLHLIEQDKKLNILQQENEELREELSTLKQAQ